MMIKNSNKKIQPSNDNEAPQDDGSQNPWMTLIIAFSFIVGIGCFLFLIGFWIEY